MSELFSAATSRERMLDAPLQDDAPSQRVPAKSAGVAHCHRPVGVQRGLWAAVDVEQSGVQAEEVLAALVDRGVAPVVVDDALQPELLAAAAERPQRRADPLRLTLLVRR